MGWGAPGWTVGEKGERMSSQTQTRNPFVKSEMQVALVQQDWSWYWLGKVQLPRMLRQRDLP